MRRRAAKRPGSCCASRPDVAQRGSTLTLGLLRIRGPSSRSFRASDLHVMSNQRPLASAQAAVHEIIGISSLSPDQILERCELMKLPCAFQLMENWAEHESGAVELGKLEIFDLIFRGRVLPLGECLLVTDSGFISGSALSCSGESLRDALQQLTEFAFDGDVVFVWPESKCISLFHHEGAFAHVG